MKRSKKEPILRLTNPFSHSSLQELLNRRRMDLLRHTSSSNWTQYVSSPCSRVAPRLEGQTTEAYLSSIEALQRESNRNTAALQGILQPTAKDSKRLLMMRSAPHHPDQPTSGLEQPQVQIKAVGSVLCDRRQQRQCIPKKQGRDVGSIGSHQCKLFDKNRHQQTINGVKQQGVITIPTGVGPLSLPRMTTAQKKSQSKAPKLENDKRGDTKAAEAKGRNAAKYFMMTWLNAGCETTKFADHLDGRSDAEKTKNNAWPHNPLKV